MVIVRWKEENEWKEIEESFALASARCRKDNTEVIVNTYGPRLNDQMKRIREAACVSILFSGAEDHDVRLGQVETNLFVTDIVPVETWMVGDLLFFAMSLGKEGSASHWCAYCDLSSALCKSETSMEGTPWTLEKLKIHLERLESGELNKKKADERKGVLSKPLFDFVDIDRYVMPTLHLILGVVNYLYKKMVEEAQADCEGYSIEYLEAKREWERAKYDAAEAKTNKNTFEATNGQYKRQLKRDLWIEADKRDFC